MPYLTNGNARDYFLEHPDGDRLHTVCLLHVHILLSHFACAAARHFSRSCLPPLTQDCPWRLESGMSPSCVEPYLHKSIFDVLQFNVLIDDSGRGVLCDFGLSRVKANVTSRTMKQSKGDVVGSRSWMAPERLTGGSLKKPCDIYAFGMTLHEVSAVVLRLSLYSSDET